MKIESKYWYECKTTLSIEADFSLPNPKSNIKRLYPKHTNPGRKSVTPLHQVFGNIRKAVTLLRQNFGSTETFLQPAAYFQ